jgi:GGDEF domain-containing protein
MPRIRVGAFRDSVPPRGESETFLEFLFRLLSAYGFDQGTEHLSDVKHGLINPGGFPPFQGQEDDGLTAEFIGQLSAIAQPTDMVDLVLCRLDQSQKRAALMVEHQFNPPGVERRVAVERRRRVAEMSPEEIRKELLTSEVTGLPNRRAFEETGAALAVAMSDVDGLKALNKFGYEAGNAVLRAKADALREAGLEAYHDKGDEFLCRDNHMGELWSKLERARAILRDRTVVVKKMNGSTLRITGADFSYGVGKDIEEAERSLRDHKALREGRGEIARGELRSIAVRAKPPNN